MLITKIVRTYSKTINSKNYGVPESWIGVTSTYEGTIESGDDPIMISAQLHEQAKKEVIANVNEIISKMKGGGTSTPPSGSREPVQPRSL